MRGWQMGLALLLLSAINARADVIGTVMVDAPDSIYGAGQSGNPGSTAATYGYIPGCAAIPPSGIPCGGYIPPGVTVSGGDTVTFTSVTGTMTTDAENGNLFNDANGTGGGPISSSDTSANNLSGITGPGAGYLVGVFLAASGPPSSAPTALNFTSGGTPGTINFLTLSPGLGQVFFIGVGDNGDSDNTIQDFIAPTGAADLYLGIADACANNGSPSCYNDNFDSFPESYFDGFFVAYDIAPAPVSVPEPASLTLFGSALLMSGLLARCCGALPIRPCERVSG